MSKIKICQMFVKKNIYISFNREIHFFEITNLKHESAFFCRCDRVDMFYCCFVDVFVVSIQTALQRLKDSSSFNTCCNDNQSPNPQRVSATL